MLVGDVPFEACDLKILAQLILKGEFEFPCDLIISEEAKDLILKMLTTDPRKSFIVFISFLLRFFDLGKRLTLDQIRSHAFLQSGVKMDSLPDYILHRAPIYPAHLYDGVDFENKTFATSNVKCKRKADTNADIGMNFSAKKPRINYW